MSFTDIQKVLRDFYEEFVEGTVPSVLAMTSRRRETLNVNGFDIGSFIYTVFPYSNERRYALEFMWHVGVFRNECEFGSIIIDNDTEFCLHIRAASCMDSATWAWGQPQPVFQSEMTNLVSKHMPNLDTSTGENVSLCNEEGTMMLNWRYGLRAILARVACESLEVYCYPCYKKVDLGYRISCKVLSHESDKWILRKDNHVYFLNRIQAYDAMQNCFCSLQKRYPDETMIEEARAREAALFEVFATGTHHRLGQSSVLGKYLLTCIIPLHEVFCNGRI
jgi:hypothetical protein